MTYSCTDFTDSILDALDIVVPDEAQDHPDMQADLAIAEIERLQALEEPRNLEAVYGGTWGQHPTHTPDDWRLDVENNDTRSGYWEWVLSQIEAAASDDLTGSIDHMPDRNSDHEKID